MAEEVVACDKREFPTEAEAEAEENRLKERTTMTIHALVLVRAHMGREGCTSGAIDCPICAGELRYRVASDSGHVHAICATEGCLSWIQ